MNWSRGLFRVWLVLALIWCAVWLGMLALYGAAPYVSPVALSYTDTGQLEEIRLGSSRYRQITDAYINGDYRQHLISDGSPTVTAYVPNIFRVSVRGQNYELAFSSREFDLRDRARLVTSLVDYIGAGLAGEELEGLRAAVEGQVPVEPEALYNTQTAVDARVSFGQDLARTAKTDAQVRQVGLFAGIALIPPVLIFILGAALIWALRGFGSSSRPETPSDRSALKRS